MPPTDTSAELKALTDEFFRAVSFESGQRPAYARIRDLFMDGGKLIRNSSELPEISSVDDFIAARQRMVDSGALTSLKRLRPPRPRRSSGTSPIDSARTRSAARCRGKRSRAAA